MIDLGAHWEFITAAYLGSALAVGSVIVWTVASARRAKRRVEALEATRAVRRGQ